MALKQPQPFFADEGIVLYHGDALDLMPKLGKVDAIVTDPPYGWGHLEWDCWPEGWPAIAAKVTEQLWCFGKLRMYWDRVGEFADWKLGQDIVWEKHNGSSPGSDRFRCVHELAVHFYRGEWESLHKEQQFTADGTARQVRRKRRPPQWGEIGEHVYTSEDGGPRQMTSVLYVRGCHGHAVNETQKPEGIVAPLVAYSVPRGGVVLDCFAGSGTTLAVARRLGRRAIGIEMRREQCDLIVERLRQRDLFQGATA